MIVDIHGRARTNLTEQIRQIIPNNTQVYVRMYTLDQKVKDTYVLETRFYISSMTCDAETHAKAIRDHWGIENGLHWVMDMVFRDDECRIRKGNAPANFTTIKHAASNMLRSVKGNQSLRLKRHLAAWDEDFLFQIIDG